MKRFLILPIIFLVACSPPPNSSPSQPKEIADPKLLTQEPGPTPEGFVWIPGGTFRMGNSDGLPDAKPVHPVELDGFWISETEITNSDFVMFVRDTAYETTAELPPNPEDFPGADPADLVPGALVHTDSGWQYIKGASWKHPTGPGSKIINISTHPVVNISYEDALAYCKWAGGTLPTEAQFEYAARGNYQQNRYTWGNEQHPNGKEMANIWQGEFPTQNLNKDDFLTTAPVKSFPPNDFGLYDMAGNVWEWCLDWYDPNFYQNSPQRNPLNSAKPNEPESARITRGGSFLCSDNYCLGYQPGTRMKTTPDTGLFHTGFRVVINPK